MPTSKFLIVIVIFSSVILLTACETGTNSESYSEDSVAVSDEIKTADSIYGESDSPLNSTAATYQNENRDLIRTADLNMEVENVYQSTQKIEMKIAELGGFVSQSNLESSVLSQEIFAVDSDSALEVKKYRVSNQMTLRVPQRELGNFLNSLSNEIEFLYFRNISAEDVSLNFVQAELEKERIGSANQKLEEISQENGKIKEKQSVANQMDNHNSDANLQMINTLRLKDEVAFSTVSLLITEKEKIAETMVINPVHFEDKYKPEFGYRAKNSLKEGFYLFQTICIGLLYLWPVWTLGCLVFLFFRGRFKKIKNF